MLARATPLGNQYSEQDRDLNSDPAVNTRMKNLLWHLWGPEGRWVPIDSLPVEDLSYIKEFVRRGLAAVDISGGDERRMGVPEEYEGMYIQRQN